MMKRYQVTGKSESAHCCFEASVIDATKEEFSSERIICECFSPEDAQRICDALNALDEQSQPIKKPGTSPGS
jgi:hypothetical protein